MKFGSVEKPHKSHKKPNITLTLTCHLHYDITVFLLSSSQRQDLNLIPYREKNALRKLFGYLKLGPQKSDISHKTKNDQNTSI